MFYEIYSKNRKDIKRLRKEKQKTIKYPKDCFCNEPIQGSFIRKQLVDGHPIYYCGEKIEVQIFECKRCGKQRIFGGFCYA